MRYLVGLVVLGTLLLAQPVAAQDGGCDNAFADVQRFADESISAATAKIEEGVIAWDSTVWEDMVRRVVGTSEFYLNNCTDAEQPLSEQTDAVAKLAEMSQIKLPFDTLDVGGDFGEVALTSDFTPTTEFMDLNGDGADELLLHTQVPYFSQDTVYQMRGGLSVAFFQSEDGWQGQVIAPVSSFVTSEEGPHARYIQGPNNPFAVVSADQALVSFPGPEVEVMEAGDGTPLTFVTLHSTTGAGEAKELDVLTWDGRIPNVALRVAFDDWCYPGSDLNWEVLQDGSVYIPSNGGEEGSPLHCGRTPEALFQWQDGKYVRVEPES